MSIFVQRVTLKNYKSIAQCRVDLGDLTILVGPNGSGKSNFLDALRLVSDSLRSTLDHALRDRGGLGEVRRKSGGHPTHFAISLRLRLGESALATYGFEIGSAVDGGLRVQREEAVIAGPDFPVSGYYFKVRDGDVVDSNPELTAKVRPDSLYLTAVSGQEVFRALFDPLSQMGFYNINPAEIRKSQPHDSGRLLFRDGRNIASMVKRLSRDDPATFERIRAFLASITPGLEAVEPVSLGPSQTLVFRQWVQGAKHPWPFFASSMSDGTLRALAILIALFQGSRDSNLIVPFIGIEEPEVAIHPGAAGVLMDALFEASKRTQILLTTHSPDLLDLESITDEHVRAVRNANGNTLIGPVDQATIEAVKDDLYTLGDLLRSRQVDPDLSMIPKKIAQGELFPRKPLTDA